MRTGRTRSKHAEGACQTSSSADTWTRCRHVLMAGSSWHAAEDSPVGLIRWVLPRTAVAAQVADTRVGAFGEKNWSAVGSRSVGARDVTVDGRTSGRHCWVTVKRGRAGVAHPQRRDAAIVATLPRVSSRTVTSATVSPRQRKVVRSHVGVHGQMFQLVCSWGGREPTMPRAPTELCTVATSVSVVTFTSHFHGGLSSRRKSFCQTLRRCSATRTGTIRSSRLRHGCVPSVLT